MKFKKKYFFITEVCVRKVTYFEESNTQPKLISSLLTDKCYC